MVLLCRSLLNFLRTLASLIRSSFFEVGKILPHPRGIRPSFFASGQGIGQKNLPGWPGLARSKKFSRGCPGGGGCTQLELTEMSNRHVLAEFQQNRFIRGVAAVLFVMRRLEKLNI